MVFVDDDAHLQAVLEEAAPHGGRESRFRVGDDEPRGRLEQDHLAELEEGEIAPDQIVRPDAPLDGVERRKQPAEGKGCPPAPS